MGNLTMAQPADSMSSMLTLVLVDSSVKAALLLTVAWASTWALRRASAGIRERIWTIAFCGVLILPAISSIVPQWRIPVIKLVPPTFTATQAETIDEGTTLTPLPRTSRTHQPQVDANADLVIVAEPEPVASHNLDASRVQGPEQSDQNNLAKTAPMSSGVAKGTNYASALLILWLMGIVVQTMRFVTAEAVTWNLLSHCQNVTDPAAKQLLDQTSIRLGLTRRVTLLQADNKTIPMTMGILRPAVLMPENWDTWPMQRLRFVMLHELAHVKRWDVLFQSIARLACILYWINPLAWYALHRMRIECELACDDHVISTGETASTYAGELIQIARTYRPVPFASSIAMARPSRLDGRIVSLLDDKRPHGTISRRTGRLLMILGTGLVVLLATLTLTKSAAVAEETETKATGKPEKAQVAQATNQAVEPARKPAVESTPTDFDETLAMIRAIGMSRGMPHPEVSKNFRGSREGGLLFVLDRDAALKDAGADDTVLKELLMARFKFHRGKDAAAMKLSAANRELAEKELSQEDLKQRRTELLDQYFAEVQALEKEHLPTLKTLFTEDQFARLQQIGMQAYGSWDLAADLELAKSLELTPDQLARVTAINEEYRRKELEIHLKRPPLRLYERLALDKDRDNRAIACLTQEQQDRYRNIVGKPFKLALLSIPEAWVKTEESMGAGRGGTGFLFTIQNQGLVNLVTYPFVVKELELSDDLLSKTFERNEQFAAAWSEAGGRVRRGRFVAPDGKSYYYRQPISGEGDRAPRKGESEDEFNRSEAKQRELWNTLSDKYLLQLEEILSADQVTRLRQIHWQVVGVEASLEPEIVKTLSITQEQQDKIAIAMHEHRIEDRKYFRFRADEALREKKAAALKQRDDTITQILTQKQLDQFATMKGKPFHFPASSAGPPQRLFSAGLRGGIFSIVRNAAVQQELEMSQDTEVDVEMIKEQFNAAWHEAGGGNRIRTVNIARGVTQFQEPAMPPWGVRTAGQPKEERDQTVAKLTESWHSITAKYQAKLKEVLTPEQYTRLKQIEWQATGVAAYSDPEVIDLLTLSKEQQDKLKSLNNQFQNANQELIAEGAGVGGGVAERNAKLLELSVKLKELVKGHEAQMKQVLTPDQVDRFAAMKGKEFDVSVLLDADQPNGPSRP